MCSMTAAIRQATLEIAMHRQAHGWVVTAYDPATDCFRESPVVRVYERARQSVSDARVERALRLCGATEAQIDAAAQQCGFGGRLRDRVALALGR